MARLDIWRASRIFLLTGLILVNIAKTGSSQTINVSTTRNTQQNTTAAITLQTTLELSTSKPGEQNDPKANMQLDGSQSPTTSSDAVPEKETETIPEAGNINETSIAATRTTVVTDISEAVRENSPTVKDSSGSAEMSADVEPTTGVPVPASSSPEKSEASEKTAEKSSELKSSPNATGSGTPYESVPPNANSTSTVVKSDVTASSESVPLGSTSSQATKDDTPQSNVSASNVSPTGTTDEITPKATGVTQTVHSEGTKGAENADVRMSSATTKTSVLSENQTSPVTQQNANTQMSSTASSAEEAIVTDAKRVLPTNSTVTPSPAKPSNISHVSTAIMSENTTQTIVTEDQRMIPTNTTVGTLQTPTPLAKPSNISQVPTSIASENTTQPPTSLTSETEPETGLESAAEIQTTIDSTSNVSLVLTSTGDMPSTTLGSNAGSIVAPSATVNQNLNISTEGISTMNKPESIANVNSSEHLTTIVSSPPTSRKTPIISDDLKHSSNDTTMLENNNIETTSLTDPQSEETAESASTQIESQLNNNNLTTGNTYTIQIATEHIPEESPNLPQDTSAKKDGTTTPKSSPTTLSTIAVTEQGNASTAVPKESVESKPDENPNGVLTTMSIEQADDKNNIGVSQVPPRDGEEDDTKALDMPGDDKQLVAQDQITASTTLSASGDDIVVVTATPIESESVSQLTSTHSDTWTAASSTASWSSIASTPNDDRTEPEVLDSGDITRSGDVSEIANTSPTTNMSNGNNFLQPLMTAYLGTPAGDQVVYLLTAAGLLMTVSLVISVWLCYSTGSFKRSFYHRRARFLVNSDDEFSDNIYDNDYTLSSGSKKFGLQI